MTHHLKFWTFVIYLLDNMADTKYEAAVQDSQRLDQELEIVQKGIELQQLRASELVEKRKKKVKLPYHGSLLHAMETVDKVTLVSSTCRDNHYSLTFVV